MYISKLCLRNYRNFSNSNFNFSKGINTLIGENGCGKTNVMQAMRVLLDETLPRTYKFYETDFNRGLDNWKGHWIIIQLMFNELDHGDEAQALAVHLVGAADEVDVTRGCCSVIFRPKYEIRKKMWELSETLEKTQEELTAIRDIITLDDYELLYTARSNTDFSLNENYETYVGDFENIIFPNPLNEEQAIFGSKLYISNFTREVSCTFIKALRDVEADLKSYRNNPLINLLRGKEKSIEIATKNEIVSKVTELNEQISSLSEVKEIADGVTSTIRSSVGETYAPNVSIKSELPADMEKLMQSLKLWVGDSLDEPYLGRIWELSLGGANLIYLSTKLLEYEKVKAQDKIANFLLIEEPEAHIHTHIQKTLFEKIPEGRTQVIISTHSTHISSVSKISSVNIISKHANHVDVFSPSKNLGVDAINRIERYLDAVRSNLLFAKGVILVEGDAEQILIPIMFKRIFGISLDEIGVSLINIGSTGFQNIATLFHADRVRKNCAIITDLDSSLIELPDNLEDDTAEQRGCRNSEVSGEARKNALDTFVDGNEYLKCFYATNTFEAQFIEAENAAEVRALVAKQYSQAATIRDINLKLNNESLSISGMEILRLANKFGKGWFAILLGEEITHLTHFPDYILKAIRFAVPHLNYNVARAIANKRYSLLSSDAIGGDEVNYTAVLEAINACTRIEQIVQILVENLPNDDLTKLLTA